MPELGKLKQIRQGGVHILGVSSGTLRPARVETTAPPYEGEYAVTPGAEAQVLETRGLRMTGNVIVNPIPQNYGLITWDGSTLTVS